jgi:membrane protein YqaA with SNARE-associated domain
LPIAGDPLTFVAGVMRIRFLDFLILVAIGKVGRYIIIMLVADWSLSLF